MKWFVGLCWRPGHAEHMSPVAVRVAAASQATLEWTAGGLFVKTSAGVQVSVYAVCDVDDLEKALKITTHTNGVYDEQGFADFVEECRSVYKTRGRKTRSRMPRRVAKG